MNLNNMSLDELIELDDKKYHERVDSQVERELEDEERKTRNANS
jgi:hypothetical protein